MEASKAVARAGPVTSMVAQLLRARVLEHLWVAAGTSSGSVLVCGELRCPAARLGLAQLRAGDRCHEVIVIIDGTVQFLSIKPGVLQAGHLRSEPCKAKPLPPCVDKASSTC